MGKFRKRTIKILCATDVAARGIDVNDITHVIHYHLPDDIENYTHRSGRTARAGKKGISIALLHIREAYKLHQIEKMAGVKFEKFMIPKGEDIITKKVQNFVNNIVELEYKDELNIPIHEEWSAPLMAMSQEELVERIIAQKLLNIDTQYAIQEDLNITEGQKSTRSSERGDSRRGDRNERSSRSDRMDRNEGGSRRDKFSSDEPTVRMFINLGKKDNLRYDEMREMIFKASKVSGHNIKDIDMKGVYSFFETDQQSADRILEGFHGVESNGREVRIQKAEDSTEGGGDKRSFSGSPKTFGGGGNRERGGFDKRKTNRGSAAGSSAGRPKYKSKVSKSW
jgi:ATP-dependent RNA helicase DeaD